MTIERVFKFLIPADIVNDITHYSYAKNLVGACIISIIAAPLYALLYFFLNDVAGALAICLVEFFLLFSLIILKYLRSLFYANFIFITALTCLLSWLTYHLGGLYSATAYWLILPPLVAAFIGGMRIAYFWCLVSIAVASVLYALEYTHYHFPNSSLSDPLFLQYTALCGLNIVIVFLVYFYESGKELSLEKLHHLAYHDALTGLPNRIAYEEILKQAVDRAKKNHSQFSIFYIDIDQFYKINTLFGRKMGDLLLKDIVNRIKRYIRHTDMMVRVGGDEFKIIIENEDIQAMNELAVIIFMALKIPYHIQNDEIIITTSIGTVLYSNHGVDDGSLDRYVDTALTKAKKSGGNCLQHFTESLAEEEALQTEIEYYLADAIKNKELSLNFQPQFDVKDPKKITGIEALLRWKNDKLGEVSPSLFIPIAEKIGIILKLGEWTLKEACKQYVTWSNNHLISSHIPLAVNISVHQLYNDNFLAYMDEVINSTGIKPDHLELELTETAIITDLPRAIAMLEDLSNLGVRLVIDDFGAGYTSLSYIDKLPLSVLKIDKSFVDELLTNDSRSIIIESMIELAHKINLTVVVEGVENIEQLIYLRKINCDYVQGYYLSKPLDIAAMQDLLTKNI